MGFGGTMGNAMSRRGFVGLCGTGVALASLAACSQQGEGAAAQSAFDGKIVGSYEMAINGYDWGCAVDRMVVTLDAPIDAIGADDLAITETKQTVDFTSPDMAVIEQEFPRTVVDAYLVDSTGEKTGEASDHFVVELGASPFEGSPLYLNIALGCTGFSDPYTLHVSLAEGASITSNGAAVTDISIADEAVATTTSADMFTKDTFEASDGVSYQYASYEPEGGSDTVLVWLHGLGEGGSEGTDPYVPLLAARAAVFGQDEFQRAVGGANVLVPQCPTYWMDNDGKKGNFVDGAIQADGSSYYTASAEELIDSYAQRVGAKKIILSGCSNGGYMVMVLAIHRPESYEAIVPVCEALASSDIIDEQIEAVKDIPAFFVYSKDDETVDPAVHEEPTIDRLRAVGAPEVHVSTSDHVIDPTGEIATEDGSPYQYEGHYSWVYFLDDLSECDEDGLGAWDFIAEHAK